MEERKRKLDGRTLVYPCVGLHGARRRALLQHRLQREVALAGDTVRLLPGTVTYAIYWTDRPYNVYHFVGPDGAVLATYCNVAAETAVDVQGVSWLDLEVDVLILPGLGPRVLDWEEVPADLSAGYRDAIATALADLLPGADALVEEVEAAIVPYRGVWGWQP